MGMFVLQVHARVAKDGTIILNMNGQRDHGPVESGMSPSQVDEGFYRSLIQTKVLPKFRTGHFFKGRQNFFFAKKRSLKKGPPGRS